jgi:uncharacterized protein YuzE
MKTYIITKHTQEEMVIRGIPESILDVVMQTPGEVVPEKEDLVAYQSALQFSRRAHATESDRGKSRPTYAGHYRLSYQQDRKILEGIMKVRYAPDTDTLTMKLSEHPVMESDEATPGVILDYDDHGNVVGVEILKASQGGGTNANH